MSEHDDKKWPGVHSQSLLLHAFINLQVIHEPSRCLKVFATLLRQKNYRWSGFCKFWRSLKLRGDEWASVDQIFTAACQWRRHSKLGGQWSCHLLDLRSSWTEPERRDMLQLKKQSANISIRIWDSNRRHCVLTLVMTDKSMLNNPAAFISTRVWTMLETSSSNCALTFSSDEVLRLTSCIRLISADQVSFTRWPLMKITSSSRMCVKIRLQLEAPCQTACLLRKPRRMLLMR